LIVSGHTDGTGSKKHNSRIARLRANAVADHLSSRGFPKDRLMVESLGESMPISTNRTASGRAMNRRVELVFVYGEMPGQKAADDAPSIAGSAEE
jgi:outer membrane protein OmpA-like peptidoglycan-associated protein